MLVLVLPRLDEPETPSYRVGVVAGGQSVGDSLGRAASAAGASVGVRPFAGEDVARDALEDGEVDAVVLQQGDAVTLVVRESPAPGLLVALVDRAVREAGVAAALAERGEIEESGQVEDRVVEGDEDHALLAGPRVVLLQQDEVPLPFRVVVRARPAQTDAVLQRMSPVLLADAPCVRGRHEVPAERVVSGRAQRAVRAPRRPGEEILQEPGASLPEALGTHVLERVQERPYGGERVPGAG